MIHLVPFLLESVSWGYLVGSQKNVLLLEMNSLHGKRKVFLKEKVSSFHFGLQLVLDFVGLFSEVVVLV